ncbi:MAG TPA: hypothetical protein VJB12_01560, partial [Candidatus Nanoarchaeia archaeon]|nr:hypothetical protein [Candidatus Nanoarchaeia archaeon]
ALLELFGGQKADSPSPSKSVSKTSTDGSSQTTDEKFQEASRLYQEAQEALMNGDFVGYAKKIEEMGSILKS